MACATSVKPARFDDILPLLVSTYQQGHLAPFLGAGVSARKLTLWGEFLARFEEQAGLDPLECQSLKITPDARAQRAGALIKNRLPL